MIPSIRNTRTNEETEHIIALETAKMELVKELEGYQSNISLLGDMAKVIMNDKYYVRQLHKMSKDKGE